MNAHDVRNNDDNYSNNKQVSSPNGTDLLNLWTNSFWPFPVSADTSRAAEHALQAFRTLFMANQAAAEAFYNAARRQQEMTFNIARTTLDACTAELPGGGAQEPDASWKRMMVGYAEAYRAGLEVTQTASGAAFKALKRAPAMLAGSRSDGAPTP